MRKKLVVGNWKMNMTRAQAAVYVESLLVLVDPNCEAEVAICPPYVRIETVSQGLRRSQFKVGAQDVFWMASGAFTGSISATMLDDAGCSYCIVGHSETRGRFGRLEIPESTLGYFSETEETINLKAKALLYHSIQPILCVGETLAERETGHTDSVISKQLEGAFDGIDGSECYSAVVAYEPVWAIGTGKTCDSAEAERVCRFIRSELCRILGEDCADAIRILYGGSVKSSNAKDLFSQPSIDGGLVGGASLDAQEFANIIRCAG